jgi:hypothetical protein
VTREKIEERYGPFGSAGRVLFMGGIPISMKGVMRKLDLEREEIVPVDCGTLGDELHFVRFVDLDDRTLAVFEIDEQYRVRGEIRSDLLKWMGDDYFRANWRVFCPGGGEEWLGRDMGKK